MLYAIKGSKYPEAQQEFLNYVATPEAQAAFTEELPYGVTTPDAKPDVPDSRAKWLAQGHESEIGTPSLLDPQWWDKNIDAAFAAWTEMTAG
jgi:putative spermidine/putrescine transport system substrate-binding protein